LDHLYRAYREAFRECPAPFAFVDLARFDQNIAAILDRAQGMPICVATKSLRCVTLLRRIQAASPQFHSWMCYSVREAVWLAGQGFDNLLVAYPVWGQVRPSGVLDALKSGKRITLMVDCHEHVEYLEAAGAEAGVTVPICLDLDMSTTYPGLHFGVRRSGIQTPQQALQVWNLIAQSPHVRLDGVMGYEAQIAGLPDSVPGQGMKNRVVRGLKRRSIAECARRRAAVVHALREAGAKLTFVNGGGTGSIESTIAEAGVVTEVTAGSGFYSPGLFDGYQNFHHQPAAGFAIEITRQPLEDIYTCHGGGYIASGAAGPDKLPHPYLPAGCALLPQEGAGEVQTPIRYTGPEKLAIGDLVFLRHSKAGELCERFNTLLLLGEADHIEAVNTYRGDGVCFL
jgi:D-serine deaminase-like pyridoxal phosphate-dependent protein